MMFQLVLTDKLREHLASVADGAGEQPMVFDSFEPRILGRVPAGQEHVWQKKGFFHVYHPRN